MAFTLLPRAPSVIIRAFCRTGHGPALWYKLRAAKACLPPSTVVGRCGLREAKATPWGPQGEERLPGHSPSSAICTQPPGQSPESKQQTCHPAEGSCSFQCNPPGPTHSLASVQPSCSRTQGCLPSSRPLHLLVTPMEYECHSRPLASLTHFTIRGGLIPVIAALLPHAVCPSPCPPHSPHQNQCYLLLDLSVSPARLHVP